ncbi:hypothetical protein CAEBREN_14558 [Caenorhabditis brenneri]|uniref:Uncharacterized protein n=1 Tax=Caenorhabditis brenneri TaxID=135651 RepID=G0NAB6_CAEBE|nr:hypothetical protein CAEBREN_14558 [Caenorhabditis brenneri]
MALFNIPPELWRCGTDGLVANLVIIKLNRTCPHAAPVFNHCCAIHDDCYDNQRGQIPCDTQLCDCMAFYVANDDEAAKCENETKAACGIVREYGHDAYAESVKNASAPAKEKYLRLPEELPSVKEQYKKVFEKCDQQHATLSSCALTYDLCRRGSFIEKSPEGCLLNLVRCLDATKPDRDSNPECDVAIEQALHKMVEKEYHEESHEENHEEIHEEEGEGSGSGHGDVNVLMMQEVLLNKTYIQRVYLQVVRQASSYSWIVYFSFCLTILICCIFSIVGIAQCNKDDHYRDTETINLHVNTTHSATSPASKRSATSSRSETMESEVSSKKK